MYSVDERDRVQGWSLPPRPCTGGPCPELFASEELLALAYYVDERDADRYPDARPIEGVEGDDLVAVLTFAGGCYAHRFGPPNDEAFEGHPLAARGLESCASHEVVDSSWIRALERMNAVHDHHDPELFLNGLRHFVLAAHDSTFECVVQREPTVQVFDATPWSALLHVVQGARQ